MKAMTRRSLLTNVTRSHHREAPGATAPSTEVRGETGGERDDGATTARQTLPAACPKGLRWPGGWRSANGSRSRAVRRNDTGGGSNAASAFGRSVRRNYSAVDRGALSRGGTNGVV